MTGAGGNEIPEQYLVYTYNAEPEPELLSRSSRTGGAPVLLGPEVIALTGLLRRVHVHFVPLYQGRANAIDVEFLVTPDPRRIVLVQARPYRVDYIDARRWSR